jgi:hypothetical protein
MRWYSCQNRKQQKWSLSGVRKHGRKMKTRPFRIVGQYNRRFWVRWTNQQQGANYFVAKLTSNIRDWRSHMVFDSRTSSIRLQKRANLALGAQLNYGTRRGGSVAFSIFRGRADQRLVRTHGYVKMHQWCLTPHGYAFRENNRLTWWNCQNSRNQKWIWQYFVPGRRVIRHIRAFRLFQLANRRFAVYMSNHQQGSNYFIAKLSYNIRDWRSHFYYDARTRSLRNAARKNFAIGGQVNHGTRLGGNTAFSLFRRRADQRVWRHGQYVRQNRWCLTPHGWTARQNGILTWYHCQNRAQ